MGNYHKNSFSEWLYENIEKNGLIEEIGDPIVVKRAIKEPKIEAYLKKMEQPVTDIILGVL